MAAIDLMDDEQDSPFFKDKQAALTTDVIPRSRGEAPGMGDEIKQPSRATALSMRAPEPSIKPAAEEPAVEKFDPRAYLSGGTQASTGTAPADDGGEKFDPRAYLGIGTQPKTEAQKPDDSGDTARGFSTALNQTPALAKGFVGVLGATGEKAFGEGGMFSSLKKYGLEGYQKDMAAINSKAKETDDLTAAWDKAKQGDLGALVDWAQYGIGYLGGNVVETVGTSLLGAGIGAAVSGPAAPVGAAAGAVEGVVAKDAVKGVVKNLVESMVAKEAAKLAEKAGVETATDVMVKQATKDVAKGIGSTAALAGSSIIKETGGIYGEAEEQAKKEGRELDAGDLARIWGSGIVAGLSEAAVDKLGLDAAGGKFNIPGGGRLGRAFVGGAVGLGVEGGQELLQTAIERYGAHQDLTGEDAMRDYINSFALGGLGGGSVGAVVGAFRDGKIDRSRAEQIIADAQKDLSSEDGRQELFDAMSKDESIAKVLQANGIESGDDPRFQSVVTRTLGTQRLLASLEMPTAQAIGEKRKERGEDVRAAFGDTASTAIGSNTGANEPLIRRDSVTPNEETKTLEGEAQPVLLPDTDKTNAGTVAMTPEDLVASQQGYKVEPAFNVGGHTQGNTFVSANQAETFLYGPINKATGQREGGYASTVVGKEFQIRMGKRSKEQGGGQFFFVESRPEIKSQPQEATNATQPANAQAQAPQSQAPQASTAEAVPATAPVKPAKPSKAKSQPQAAVTEQPAPAAPAAVAAQPQPATPAAPVVAEKQVEPAAPTAPAAPAQVTATEQPQEAPAAAAPAKPAKKTKAKAEPKPAKSDVRKEAIEAWEDNDDGKVAHIPFVKLSKEAQADWIAATRPDDGEKPYNTAELHDQIVSVELRNQRTERINQKNAENKAKAEDDTKFSRTEGAPQERPARGFTYSSIKTVGDLVAAMHREQARNGEPQQWNARRVSVGDAAGRVPGIGLIEKTARLFGKSVVFFEVTSGRDFFNGAVLNGTDTVFVNINANRAHIRILGHEIVHAIRNSDERVYNQLKTALIPMLDSAGYADYVAKQRNWGVKNEEKILEEAIADIVGDRFGEREFWNMLAEQNPTMFQRAANVILQFLDSVLTKIAGNKSLGSETLVKDLKAAREQIAEIMAQNRKDVAKELGLTEQEKGEAGALAKQVKDDSVMFARKFAETEDPRDPDFMEWFGSSHTTDDMGKPVPWYHGTAQNISVYRAKQAGAIFITPQPRFAEQFSEMSQDWMARNYWKVLTDEQIKAAREDAYAAIRKEYKKTKADREYAETLIQEIEDDDARGESQDFLSAAILNHLPSGPNIMPVYVKSEKPFDYDNKEHVQAVLNEVKSQPDFDPTMAGMYKGIGRGEWPVIEMPDVQAAIKALGFDSFYVNELGVKNLAVYDPRQIKSIFNMGTWGVAPVSAEQAAQMGMTEEEANAAQAEGHISFSRKEYTRQFADLDAKTQAIALAKGHVTPPTVKDRLKALGEGSMRMRVVQGVFDRFRSVKDISLKAYMMLRMSNGPQDGALSVLLHYGQVFNDDGALNLKKGTKGLLEVLKNVGGETDRFLLWIAANRAENLSKQERERFFTADEIKALKALDKNSMADGRSRYAVYRETLRQMNELNKSVLDVARQTGLINEQAYQKFANDIWYIPFYRQMDEDGSLSAAQTSSSAVGQYLSKQLKGSERPLNDLMENVLMNWSHILSASMKNQAAVETLKSASQMQGVVSRITPLGKDNLGKDAQGNVVPLKGTVKVMEKGETVHYRIDDEFLLASLDAVANVPSYGFWTQTGRMFKTTLTKYISLSPTFKINNLLRDSIQSIGMSELKANPVANVIEGWSAYMNERAEALAGGGLFAMGNAFDGDRAANVKHLVKKGVPAADIWTTDEKVKEGLKTFWDKYDEVSDAMENANRIALYKQLREKGASHLEAAYAARDLQDFSLQGTATAVRYLSQILPYFNARLQGLYKIGRDGIDPCVQVLTGNANESEQMKAKKFATVLGAVTMFGVMLYLSQKDDPDYDKLEDWERDSFFWFKIPGTQKAIRIPKPFEMGAFETVIERATEQMVDANVEGKVFGKRLLAVLADNLAINPIPQAVRPLYDIARNKDGFTDRPIESMGMERLSKSERVNPGTSGAAIALGTVNSLFANFVEAATGGAANAQNLQLSPIQYDYMLRGYLGWVGTAIQTSSNVAVDTFKPGESSRFERIDDMLVVGNFVKTMPQSQSKYVTGFYESAQTAAMAVADAQHYINLGQFDKAQEIYEQKKDVIALNKLYTKASSEMAEISKQTKLVEDSPSLSGAEKRLELERLQQLRVDFAKSVEEIRKSTKAKAKFADGGEVSGKGLAPYGIRHAESASEPFEAKGKGYFGELSHKGGSVSTEISASNEKGSYPLLVPTLNKDEVDLLLSGEQPTDAIYDKAEQHAERRRAIGKSPFAQPDELRYPVPKD